MARVRRLSRPPITEALVDIRVTLAPSFRPESFRAATDRLKERYPTQEEMQRFQAMFEFRGAQPVEARHTHEGLVGLKFSSADGRDVAQFRKDGFTYNRLAPYSSWNDIRPEALRLWRIFVDIARPRLADRVALRYINRLELPPSGLLEEHLEAVPPRFQGAPPVISQYLLRQSSYDPVSQNAANIAEVLEPAAAGGTPTLIVDVDVYNAAPREVSEGAIGPVLDSLRTMKNEIFFGSITERTAERYQ